MATYTGGKRAVSHQRMVLVAWGAAFALAVLTGVGGWQLGVHSRGSHEAAPAAQQVTTAAQQSAPVSEVPAVSGSIVPVARTEPASLILVGSAEQASQVQRGISEADEIRAQTGVPPLNSTVLQVEEAEQANAAVRAVADENSLRVTLGLPEIKLVDLRSAASTTEAQPANTQAVGGTITSVAREDAIGGFAESLRPASAGQAFDSSCRDIVQAHFC
jgi:cytoskeletal protein RodZ